ncbi:RNA polymerase sigma factor [Bacillus sp. REN10]|uniref:RNA polymerase sigma factor n=1 Tax=Bacillus sp. REN10 TaxID=2782541 RepID=UPI00193C507E|nr:RNA polymerase sigma factor [Bacillus sp. REN10]
MSIEDLYRTYFQDLYAYLLSLSRNRHITEELLQETFYRAYIHLDSYRGENPKPWLFKIAYHTFIDWTRSEKKWHQQEITEAMLPTVQSTEQIFLTQAKINNWLRIVQQLPLTKRHAILLRDYYGFSYEEISWFLNLTIANVKVILHRTRKEVRKRLGEEE